MSSNALFFGWNRSIPGREGHSAEHFTQFSQWLTDQQKKGQITRFSPVFLQPHGGDLSGFFLIEGDTQKLHELVENNEWVEHIVRASLHLEGVGAVFASTGNEVMNMMQVWTKSIPRS